MWVGNQDGAETGQEHRCSRQAERDGAERCEVEEAWEAAQAAGAGFGARLA